MGSAHLCRTWKSRRFNIDFQREITDPLYDKLRVTTLPVFRCPSDSVEQPLVDVKDSSGGTLTQVAFANYVGVGGTFEVSVYPDEGTGVLFRNHEMAIKQITDGLSHTIMVSERASRQSPQTTWVGRHHGCRSPTDKPRFEAEGPPVLVLTNTGRLPTAACPTTGSTTWKTRTASIPRASI